MNPVHSYAFWLGVMAIAFAEGIVWGFSAWWGHGIGYRKGYVDGQAFQLSNKRKRREELADARAYCELDYLTGPDTQGAKRAKMLRN